LNVLFHLLDPPDITNDLKQEVYQFLEKINNHITETKAKHRQQIITLSKWKRKDKKQSDKYIEEGEYVSTEMTPDPS
jgi:ferritin-like metal-binding protein YciE